MRKILINDGIEESGLKMLVDAGFEVNTNKISQENLMHELNGYDAICVRSATKVRKELIDASPNLKVIARGGVGMDNIDVDYARSKGIEVINTPAASSRSVAELAFAHILTLSRLLHLSNRAMPVSGNTSFDELKKKCAGGHELEGKTLGVIGMGRIGQEAMKIGIAMGMEVIGYDPFVDEITINFGSAKFNAKATIPCTSLNELLITSDFITLHVPGKEKAILGNDEFSRIKKGAIVVNCARGGVIAEEALLDALNNGTLAGAGLDVFEGEPRPRQEILTHPKISLSPHIGASTAAAQEKVGGELASQLIKILG